MVRFHGIAVTVVATVALVLGGCASRGGASAGPTTGLATARATSTPTESSASTEQPSVVPDTLRFSAPLVGGGRFDGAMLANRPAVLWFWAAWCSRCRAKADDINGVQAQYGSKVSFVGVAGLASGSNAMQSFIDQYGLTGFPHLADDEGVVWRHFGVTEQEYFVILDDGKVVYKGPMSTEDLQARVRALAG